MHQYYDHTYIGPRYCVKVTPDGDGEPQVSISGVIHSLGVGVAEALWTLMDEEVAHRHTDREEAATEARIWLQKLTRAYFIDYCDPRMLP